MRLLLASTSFVCICISICIGWLQLWQVDGFLSTSTSSRIVAARPPSFWTVPDLLMQSKLAANKGFIGMDEDDEDEDDEDEDDEDEDDEFSTSLSARSRAAFSGLSLDPSDPNPVIKPRPSRFFKNDGNVLKNILALLSAANNNNSNASTSPGTRSPLVQKLDNAQRKENLEIMRTLQVNDLPDLRRRKDHAGWVQANQELERRKALDVWFMLNEQIKNAVQYDLGEDIINDLKRLAERVGGPPPGITINPKKGYAVHSEIYNIPLSPSRAASTLERQVRMERAARGKAMMAERQKNLEKQAAQYEEDMRNPGVRRDKEAKERRERTMRRMLEEIAKDNQKKRERAKEILGKVPEPPASRLESMEKALAEAKEDVLRMKRKMNIRDAKYRDGTLDDKDSDSDGADGNSTSSGSGSVNSNKAATTDASGRPRLPGDPDVTKGEVNDAIVKDHSVAVTDGVTVEVRSSYNTEQSDPPMRKHCFQYTIRITNNNAETIQLLGRRFEIQTVGSSMKDVVQGEGVTGRTPILKSGEVFEYTSTAPLSVRPIGTTIIAARMRGDYSYVRLATNQETATPEQIKNPEAKAELGTFHFIFPEAQRVKPFKYEDEGDDDEDDEEEDDDEPASVKKASSSTTVSKASTTVPSPTGSGPPATAPYTPPSGPTTLPGDRDMESGVITIPLNDSSESVTDGVRVHVTSSYRPERSDAAADKHCFAYNIRITNEKTVPIQLVSRRFEIQTVKSSQKDIVQGPGVTGRQPILQPGESFEYTSTAPLNVKAVNSTPVLARMQGEYNFLELEKDGTATATSMAKPPKKAKLTMFHFILPAMV